MNTDRDELIDAMARAGRIQRVRARLILDALLAHPGVVLRELEHAKCDNCDEGQVEVYGRSGDFYEFVDCPACGGSGILGREGVLALLGWDLDVLAGHLDAHLDSLGHTDVSSREWLAEFVEPQPCVVCGVLGGHRRLRPASRTVRDELLGVMVRAHDAHDGDDYLGAVLDALLAAPRIFDACREAGTLEQAAQTERLYGREGDEELDAELEDAIDRVSSYCDDTDTSFVIEEWDVHPPEDHMPDAEGILTWLSETSAENDVCEGWWESCENACGHPEVVAAANALRSALAARITFRMARTKLRDITVVLVGDEWVPVPEPSEGETP